MKNAYAQLLKTFQKQVLEPDAKAAPRMGIYRKAYRTRLIDVLKADYPLLEKALGSKPFVALVQEYINESPSRFWDLQHYSEAFVDFVAKKHNSLPGWAGPLANIERAQFRVLDKVLSPAFILSDTPDLPTLLTLSLRAQDASEFVDSRYDLEPLLEGKPGEPAQIPTPYFVYSNQGAPELLPLEEMEAQALRLMKGGPLSEWLEAVFEALGDKPGFGPEKIQQWLFRWTSKKMLS